MTRPPMSDALHGAVLAFPHGPHLDDLNPLTYLGDAVLGPIGDGAWTTAMLALWGAGRWMTQWVFTIVDALATPDLSPTGPLQSVLPTTLWISATLALILGLVQLAVALVRRDGQSIGRIGLGILQYAFVWGGFLGAAAVLVTAAGGLEKAILHATLGVNALSGYDVTGGWVRHRVDADAATLLGVTALLLLIPAAFFQLLIGLLRAASLIVLVAVTPITAAGLMAESTKPIFWKSFRWFLAAVLIAPDNALILGIGEKVSAGVVAGQGDTSTAAIGTSVIGAGLVVVAAISPIALYRLLAWVDPGTPSGAALRQSWSQAGGLAGLTGGGSSSASGAGAGPGLAGQIGEDGRSGGESTAEAATASRMATAMAAFGTGVQTITSIALRAGDLSADVLGGAGVGSPGYSMSPADEQALSSTSTGSGGAAPNPQNSPPAPPPAPGPSGTPGSPGPAGSPGPTGPRPAAGPAAGASSAGAGAGAAAL